MIRSSSSERGTQVLFTNLMYWAIRPHRRGNGCLNRIMSGTLSQEGKTKVNYIIYGPAEHTQVFRY